MIPNPTWDHIFVGSCKVCHEPTVLHYRITGGLDKAEWEYIDQPVACPRVVCHGVVNWVKLVAVDQAGGAEKMDLRDGRLPPSC